MIYGQWILYNLEISDLGLFSLKAVFPFTSPIALIVDNSLEMIFAGERVRFDISEHLEFLQNLDFISEAHNIATKFVT